MVVFERFTTRDIVVHKLVLRLNPSLQYQTMGSEVSPILLRVTRMIHLLADGEAASCTVGDSFIFVF